MALAFIGTKAAAASDAFVVQSSWHRTQKVFALEQTDDGVLWAGTDGGLIRYDGRDFVTLTSSQHPELRSNVVTSLWKDTDGALWLGLDDGQGVARLSQGRVESIDTGDALAGKRVLALVASGSRLWVGTSAGLFQVELGTKPVCRQMKEVGNVAVSAIKPVANGSLWVGAQSGLFKAEGNTFTRTGNFGPIQAIAADHSGNVWVSDAEVGVYKIARAGETTLAMATNAAHSGGAGFTALATDGKDNVWVGWEGGFGRLAEGELAQVFSNGLSTVALLPDREGGVWVGTFWGVVIRVFRPRVRTEVHAAGDEPKVVFGLAADKQGALWLAQVKSVVKTTPTGIRRYESGKDLPTWCPRSLYPARTGGMWLATCDKGLFRITGDAFESLGPDAPPALRNIQTLFEDDEGDLWLGTVAGELYLRSHEQTTLMPLANGTCDPNRRNLGKTPRVDDECRFSPTAIIRAEAGGVWVALRRNGLRRVWKGGSIALSKSEGLPTNDLNALYEDRAHTLWIGTQAHGLVRYRDGVFKLFDRASGLGAQSVHGIAEDDRGQLWMSGENGVFRVAKQNLEDFAAGKTDRIMSYTYGTADGLASPITVQCFTSPLVFNGGVVAVPLDMGLGLIDTNAVDQTAGFAKVIFESVRVNGVLSTVTQAPKFDLPPGALGALEFKLSVPNFDVPHRVDIEYRLLPKYPKWLQAAGERVFRFSDLPPGRYQVEARPVLDGRSWGDSTLAPEVRLRGFRERPMFWLLVAVAFLPVLALVVILRLRYLRIKTDAILQERGRVARELHDTLAQYFTGISYQLARLTEAIPTNPAVADKIAEDTKMILLQCRLETRQAIHDLRSSDTDDHSVVKSLKRLADETRLSGDINVDFVLRGQEWPFEERVFRQLTRIAQEATVNALSHSQASCITMTLDFSPSEFVLQISDDGEGFDLGAGAKPLHFGLQGIKERADVIGARLSITSSLGSGTEIKVALVAPGQPVE